MLPPFACLEMTIRRMQGMQGMPHPGFYMIGKLHVTILHIKYFYSTENILKYSSLEKTNLLSSPVMKRFLKFFIGLALLPMCYGYSIEFLKIIAVGYKNPVPSWGLLAGGALTYILMHIILPKPMLLHIFGHELTHAFFAKLFGWKVKDIKVSSNGGHAKLSGSNFIVTLAPYFFPFYSFIVLMIYILAILTGYDTYIYPYFLFLTGFTLSLHILMTIVSVKTDQPDIKEGGLVFSIPLIYLGNLLTIALLLRLTVLRGINYFGFLKMGWMKSWEIWKVLVRTASP